MLSKFEVYIIRGLLILLTLGFITISAFAIFGSPFKPNTFPVDDYQPHYRNHYENLVK